MQKDLTLESLDKSLEQSKKAELEKQQQIELESMNEFQKSLKTSLQTELDLIKDDILEMQKSVNKNNKTLAENSKGYSEEITKNFQSMSQELTKLKAKQWIIPTAIGLSIVLALALGTWGVTKYLESQLLALGEVRAKKAQIGKMNQVLQVYQNEIELYQKPKVWETKDHTWVVELEE